LTQLTERPIAWANSRREKHEGSSPGDRATRPDLVSILLPWSFPPQEK
jgi:hypothetical protein